jgi:archaellum component FlaC
MERLKDILCNALSAVANHEIIQASRMQRKLGIGEQTMKLNRKKTKDDCKWKKVFARNVSDFIAYQEQLIESYRQELGKVRVALAEANKERQELTADLEAVRSRADETIDALHSEVRELTSENEILREKFEQRPPKLIITKLPKKENENV